MSALFANGHIVDLILALMLLEAVALMVLRARTGHGLPTSQVLVTLLSGAALMLALRAALVGMNWAVVAACLFAGLVLHLLDLASRWR